MQLNYHELEQIIINSDHKVDIFWQQRLLKKHKNLDQFKKKLNLCFGYYHQKITQEIIKDLQQKNILEKYVENTYSF